MSWQFTVGLRVKGKADRIVVDAEDALIAALKAKADQPGATIMYVRRSNRRGDTRHPPCGCMRDRHSEITRWTSGGRVQAEGGGQVVDPANARCSSVWPSW